MDNAHTPSMWHQEFALSKKSLIPPWVLFWTRSKPPPTRPSRKDGKTNDYNRLFAFFLGPEKHKEQGLWQAPLSGCSASEETAPAGEMKVWGGCVWDREDRRMESVWGWCGGMGWWVCVWGLVRGGGCQEGRRDGRWWGRSRPRCHNPMSRGATSPSAQRQIIAGGISRTGRICHLEEPSLLGTSHSHYELL